MSAGAPVGHASAEALEAAQAAMGLGLDPVQQAQLLAYLALIEKWNRVYNLTAVRDPAAMLTHHLLDSLAAVAPLRREWARRAPDPAATARVLDVGSGAGLPGVVLAICCPVWRVDCVDAVAKKAAFIQQVAVDLELPHLRGIHGRVERLSGPYDLVCSRAFASLADFAASSAAALASGGAWLAMKGKQPGAEIAALPAGVEVFHVEPVKVPGLDADRCLVWMKKTGALT